MIDSFDKLNLSKQLLSAIAELGFTVPTPVQNECFSVIMSGKDVIGIAQTGTGKTLAYVLPILQQLKYSDQINGYLFVLPAFLIIGLFGFTVVVLYLIFILLDYDSVHSGWKRFIPIRYRDIVLTIWDDVTLGMNGYFRAQALIATIVGILFAIGFSLISLPMGVLFGLLIGILNMVPYLQMVAIMPCTFFALVYALETGNSFWVMMGLIVLLFIVIQTIQDMIHVPKIMGNLTGFNPAIILLSLLS